MTNRQNARTDHPIEGEVSDLIELNIEQNYHRIQRDREQLIRDEGLTRAGFESRLFARWERAFDTFDLLLIAARSFGERFNQEQSSSDWTDREALYAAIVRIHARACLIASEVRALLVSGHASGALARWRSLHELWVTAAFLYKHGNDVAHRYMDHADMKSARAAELYVLNYRQLGYEPLDTETFEQTKKNRQQLVSNYGSRFADDYGWASGVLPGRVTFSKIEQDVGLHHWRSHFLLASHSVHAGFKGMSFDIGVSDLDFFESTMLAGPSNVGLTDPAHCTAIALINCTISLLHLRGSLEDAIAIHVLLKLANDVGTTFLSVQKEIEEEESKLRHPHGDNDN